MEMRYNFNGNYNGFTKSEKNDTTMVFIDKLTKEVLLITIKSTFNSISIAKIFMKLSFRLHGALKKIISYRDVKFTSNLWKGLAKCLDTHLNFSITYHPQTIIMLSYIILEDMLLIYVKDKLT